MAFHFFESRAFQRDPIGASTDVMVSFIGEWWAVILVMIIGVIILWYMLLRADSLSPVDRGPF